MIRIRSQCKSNTFVRPSTGIPEICNFSKILAYPFKENCVSNFFHSVQSQFNVLFLVCLNLCYTWHYAGTYGGVYSLQSVILFKNCTVCSCLQIIQYLYISYYVICSLNKISYNQVHIKGSHCCFFYPHCLWKIDLNVK